MIESLVAIFQTSGGLGTFCNHKGSWDRLGGQREGKQTWRTITAALQAALIVTEMHLPIYVRMWDESRNYLSKQLCLEKKLNFERLKPFSMLTLEANTILVISAGCLQTAVVVF